MRRIWGTMALTLLAACGDTGGDYPALLPTDRLLVEPALPAHAAEAGRDPAAISDKLDARGQSLAGRAGAKPVPGDALLQQRAQDLRARAKALSQQSLAGDCSDEDGADCAPN
ncbi:hypothetical protein JWJ88_04960 [Paracoccus methylovorus]|uniref:DUF3035 domain-containing protein n=1 Tax=Paracoccus methylovorus TaxID=2812658 RepID=A0ABX7JL29_9RHOB|nr:MULTISPECIES: hypothetical protein [Paracoccus]QRZ14013.1 hypothetical protein JWJ88_04960 [Paracoccus methylovorus]